MIKQLLNELEKALPKGELISREELKGLISSLASRLDLVTREEFDAQTAVLARTRQLLESLETKLAQLEQASSEK
jgi:ubiquinone biosynthesis accessory factor UbiK